MEASPDKSINMAPKRPQNSQRIAYLDATRVFLTTLVIVHHTAIPYGGEGELAYKSQHHRRAGSPPLLLFNVLNQTFFMALFFFISGANSHASLSRRPRGVFLRNKWCRLGVPCLVYSVLAPALQVLSLAGLRGEVRDADLVRRAVAGVSGVGGPTWYLALLLLFDTAYALLPDWMRRALRTHAGGLGAWTILVLDCAVTFLIRLGFPTSYLFRPLNLRVGYTPQYVLAYLAGVQDETLSAPASRFISRSLRLVLVTISAGCMLGAYIFVSNSHLSSPGILASAQGGMNPLAALYVVWNEVTGYLLGGGFLDFFKERLAGVESQALTRLSRYAYATFLVHVVVSIAVEVTCEELWVSWGLGKFFAVATLNVLACWSAGWLLCKVPGVSKLLL